MQLIWHSLCASHAEVRLYMLDYWHKKGTDMKLKLHWEDIISIPVQIALLIVSFIILALCLYWPITRFAPVDSRPGVQQLSAESDSPSIVHIQTGLSITDFLKFDAIKNEYTVNAVIWFAFDPKQVSLQNIEKFSFTKGDILKKSDPVITQLADNKMAALYYIRVQFATIPNYKRFPLDDHYLFLNVINTALYPTQAVFDIDQNDYTLAENLYSPGWAIVEHSAQGGYSQAMASPDTLSMQPKAIFSIGLSKQDYRQLLLIILPLLVIFYFGIFAFSIKDIVLAITLVLASVSGLVAYSFVIQTLSPQVGYLMLSDYMFLLFLGTIFVVFFITALNATPEHILSKKAVERIKGITLICIYIVLIVLWYYLTNIKDIPRIH